VTLADLRFACQTYSWQMSIDRYRGRVRHMAGVAADAGFAGFEPELVMLGEGWTADLLARDLEEAGIQLAAIVLAQPWRGMAEDAAERTEAARAIDAAARLGATLVLVPLPGADRSNLRERQRAAMSCMDDVAARALDAGVRPTFHPNSPAGSVFRTAEDYQVMADTLPPNLGYTPDVGHIAKGGMDPLTVIREWRDRVDHVHVKDLDADGKWAPTGEGIIDIPGVLDELRRTTFEGWITFEDESPAAQDDPDTATHRNGEWVRNWLETS
jgi:inosose dehydratase